MKENVTFKYLKALLILMVIDDHVSSQIGILSNVFPYNSFYMPLFVCISGYFYKDRPIIVTMKKLVINLLVPYIIWSFIGNSISMILAMLNISNWYRAYDLRAFIQLFTYGTFSSLTHAGWFVIMLFWVRSIYSLLRKIVTKKLEIDYLLLLVLVLISIISVKACMSGYANNAYNISAFRLFFYLLFYHVGYMFSNYWEDVFGRYNRVCICLLCIALNVILISIWGDSVNFYATKEMQSFKSAILPYLTFVTGSVFWYEICSLMAEKIGNNKYVDFISRNTFTIMMSHLFFTNIPNFFIMYMLMYKDIVIEDFNYVGFYQSASLVRYNTTTRLLGFLFAVVGCCVICIAIERIKRKYKHLINIKETEKGE